MYKFFGTAPWYVQNIGDILLIHLKGYSSSFTGFDKFFTSFQIIFLS